MGRFATPLPRPSGCGSGTSPVALAAVARPARPAGFVRRPPCRRPRVGRPPGVRDRDHAPGARCAGAGRARRVVGGAGAGPDGLVVGVVHGRHGGRTPGRPGRARARCPAAVFSCCPRTHRRPLPSPPCCPPLAGARPVSRCSATWARRPSPRCRVRPSSWSASSPSLERHRDRGPRGRPRLLVSRPPRRRLRERRPAHQARPPRLRPRPTDAHAGSAALGRGRRRRLGRHRVDARPPDLSDDRDRV